MNTTSIDHEGATSDVARLADAVAGLGDYVRRLGDAFFLTYFWTLWASDKMFEADDWVMDHFQADSEDEASEKYPRGSKEKYYQDIVAAFWELAGYLVATGRMDEEGFMELFGGHPRTRWQKFERMYKSGRENPIRPEAAERAKYFEWLARRSEEITIEEQEQRQQTSPTSE